MTQELKTILIAMSEQINSLSEKQSLICLLIANELPNLSPENCKILISQQEQHLKTVGLLNATLEQIKKIQ